MHNVAFQQTTAAGQTTWLAGLDMAGTIEAYRLADVAPALQAVQRAADGGMYAVGFVSYEAAPGLDASLQTHAPGTLPLVWFGLFHALTQIDPPPRGDGEFEVGNWQPSVTQDEYRRAIGQVKEYIAAGDTYQVNYTMRLRTSFCGEAWPFFHRICRAQRAKYCAYIDTGRHVVCSASPELFFSLDDGVITSRPMKGTVPRGRDNAEDRAAAAWLAASAKNQAENAMIVDMMRNDLGRVAVPGSVRVSDIFKIERYPTVFQMTSTVSAATRANFAEIMQAIFPCASITGAPKVRTMQIIRELEGDARGLYTGCVGYVAPGGRAQFNVAIRTAVIDREAGTAEYGIGGGVVWDSQSDDEYAECLAKAAVLTTDRDDVELLETILWEPDSGYFLLDGHLRRLAESAEYFDIAYSEGDIRARLAELAATLTAPARRVRLVVADGGRITIEQSPLTVTPKPYRLKLAAEPIELQIDFSEHGRAADCKLQIEKQKQQEETAKEETKEAHGQDARATHGRDAHATNNGNATNSNGIAAESADARGIFLRHKTTRRAVYEAARRGWDDCDDVVLWNSLGQVTETTIANIVVEIAGRLYTPPLECGLLGGVFRAHLLETGQVSERIITVEDLQTADRIFAINSVRKWMPAILIK
ncbi:MAG: aminodeoxychorismate synthase component I [Planctomycetaceae bacterium]|nr:MAG: aminodeoxychorismate synthase component I [Planctomycetaceae bacterium]